MSLLKNLCKNRKAVSTILVVIIVVAAITLALVAQRPPWEGAPTTTTTETTTETTTPTTTETTTETTTPTTTEPTGTEALTILPESSLTAVNKRYDLIVENTGTGDASIILIKVGGTDVANVRSGGFTRFPIPVKAGEQVKITGNAVGSFLVDESYEVQIHTAAGNVYTSTILGVEEELVM